MAAIGIDLGKTNSCVAVLQNDQVEVLQNDHTNRVTPSCVAYNDHEQLIGDDAKEQRGDNPENTIFSVKRLIGRQFSDETVQDDLKHFPFKVVRDYRGGPKIRVKTNKGEKEMFPEEISGIVLSEMKKIAEERIGGKVYNAVITVPAYFNDAQRRATKAAAKIAGLHVLEIIGEPDAAAIAYTQQQKIPKERNVLVYDLGGGTFDVTVLTIRGADVTVLATGGDTHLGGDDFSYRMLGHFVEEFEKKWGINVMGNAHAKARLIQKCEKLKLKLSTKKMENIKVSALADGKDFNSQVTRAKFEDWNEDIFSGTLDTLKEVLGESKISRAEVDEVLLVGGSTRIPYIHNMLEKYFGAAKILQKVNPDEAVAYGAAVYAAHLSGVKIPGIGEVRVRSVYPVSLGIAVIGELMSVIIKRNTPIPTKQTKKYCTTKDNQSGIDVEVYAGERAKLEDNTKLDDFVISPIPLRPKGEVCVEVTLELNRGGILDVTASEKSTGVTKSISVKPDRHNWSDNEIADMRGQAEEFRKRDNEYREQVSARNALEGLVYNVKRRSRSFATFQKCEAITVWMENNKNASRDAYVAKRKELEVFEAFNN